MISSINSMRVSKWRWTQHVESQLKRKLKLGREPLDFRNQSLQELLSWTFPPSNTLPVFLRLLRVSKRNKFCQCSSNRSKMSSTLSWEYVPFLVQWTYLSKYPQTYSFVWINQQQTTPNPFPMSSIGIGNGLPLITPSKMRLQEH